MGWENSPHPPSLTQRSSSSTSSTFCASIRRRSPHIPENHMSIQTHRRTGGRCRGPEVCWSFGRISSSPVPMDALVSASVNPPHTKSRKWLQVHFLKGPVPLKWWRGADCCRRSSACMWNRWLFVQGENKRMLWGFFSKKNIFGQ